MPDPSGGARLTQIPQWLIQRASGLFGQSTTAPSNSLQPKREPWFGPGETLRPVAPVQDVSGRAWDYPNQYNLSTRPRQWEGVSFATLRGLADSLDIVRLAIETRKDQMGKLTWSILPTQHAAEAQRAKADARCDALESFLKRPDRRTTWQQWLNAVIEDQLVIDAVSIYVRRTVGGDVYSLEVVDGADIKPILDTTGRMPLPPEYAYQHILKGFPAVDYTSEELLYAPKNTRSHSAVGFSIVNQIMMTINIGVRREIAKLAYFTAGNIPEALISVPEDWTPDQISRFQKMWDELLATAQTRAGAKFVPGKMNFQPTRSDATLMGPFDEWMARVVCYAFSLPPTAFVQQQNRATAEQSYDTSIEEGLAPMMVWFKGLMDRIIQDAFGYADLEFVFDDVKQIDTLAAREQDRADAMAGIMGWDEYRAKIGLDPIGVGNVIVGGPNGLIFVDDILKAKAQGLTAIQPPQQFDEFGNPIPTMPQGLDPGQQSMGGVADPAQGQPLTLPAPAAPQGPPATAPDALAGVPPEILSMVGLGPDGRVHDVTQQDEQTTDPLSAAVPHPQVLKTLRDAEANQTQRGLR